MKVLVTGASGFLGSHLLRLLQENEVEIHTIDLKPSLTGIQHNVLYSDAVGLKNVLMEIDPAFIVHLAGVSAAPDIQTYYGVNTFFAANLIWAVKEWGNKKCPLILTGTSAEYGMVSEKDLPITETAPTKPYDHYGISKLAQTLMGVRESRGGWPLIMIRPFNIIGPGMPGHLALQSFTQQVVNIKRGISQPIIEVGDLSPIRDFVDVRDVAHAIWMLLHTPSAYGEVINICTGFGTSIGALLDKLTEMANLNVDIRTAPHKIKPIDVPVHFGSNEKLRNIIGFTHGMDLNKTIMDILEYNLSLTNIT